MAPIFSLSRILRGAAFAVLLSASSCFMTESQIPASTGEADDRSEIAIGKAARATAAVKREAIGAIESPDAWPPKTRIAGNGLDIPDIERDELKYDIEWNGPIEPLLAALAKSRQVELLIKGRKPSKGGNVALYDYGAQLPEIIRRLDEQLAGIGKLELLPFESGIRLDYGR